MERKLRKNFLLLLFVPLLLAGCSTNQTTGQATPAATQQHLTAKDISQWTYKSGEKPVKILNNDKPTEIKKTDFNQSHIDYEGLDSLKRTKTATAYLTRNNLGRSNTRTEQVWRPTGWHNQPKYVNGTRVIPQNRGHLIAYTMTFNLNKSGQTQQGELGSIDNPYNLFTQTEFSNQKTMTQVEQKVRDALAQNKKVIYRVTPIFHGQELMARGVWVQAMSMDGSLKFNRYLWNVQNKIKFDYMTGKSEVDNNWKVPEVEGQRSNYHHSEKRHYYHKKY